MKWTWASSGHSTTSGSPGQPNGIWDSGLRNQGATFTRTFNNAGTFPYYCVPHGGCCAMVGTVSVVSETPTPTPHPTATPTSTPRPTATATPRPTATPAPTSTPVVTTNPATKVAAFSATLNGTVNPRGATTMVNFQWSHHCLWVQYTPCRPKMATRYGLSVPILPACSPTTRIISELSLIIMPVPALGPTGSLPRLPRPGLRSSQLIQRR